MSGRALSMRIISWYAHGRDLKRHAHFGNQRVCCARIVPPADYCIARYRQPKKLCTACRMRLANALRPQG